ncbi:MAG: response regulator [Myxococcaceae bacterium]
MRTILLVEDDDDTREALAEGLRLSGFEVTTFRTGIHAIEYLGCEKPDAVVLDSALPWVDGEEVLKAMRTSPRLKDVPAVIITADPRRLGRAQTLTPYVIAKPFDTGMLVALLGRLVEESGSAENAGSAA